MSSIGSGPGISPGAAVEVGAVRVVGSPDLGPAPQRALRDSGSAPSALTPTAASAASIVTSTTPGAGAVPIDQDRVATIRRAIETNSYPVVPTKIGDAMIAAGMLLRMPT